MSLLAVMSRPFRQGRRPCKWPSHPTENLLVPDRQANDLRIYDAATRALHKTISVRQDPSGIVIPPDGKTIYIACQSSNNVNVIDAANWSVTIEMGRGPGGLAIR